MLLVLKRPLCKAAQDSEEVGSYWHSNLTLCTNGNVDNFSVFVCWFLLFSSVIFGSLESWLMTLITIFVISREKVSEVQKCKCLCNVKTTWFGLLQFLKLWNDIGNTAWQKEKGSALDVMAVGKNKESGTVPHIAMAYTMEGCISEHQ